MKYLYLLLPLSLYATEPLVPIAYKCETNYLQCTKFSKQPIKTPEDSMAIIKTNWPIAITHSVTFGRGTNAIFVMKSCEPLLPPPPEWTPIDWENYYRVSWIEKP